MSFRYNSIFELEPKARSLFNFTTDEDYKVNPKFYQQAHMIVDMMDMAVGFLGPDLDPLKDDLVDLGKRHVGYGVTSDYLPIMERGVMYALEEVLDDKRVAAMSRAGFSRLRSEATFCT